MPHVLLVSYFFPPSFSVGGKRAYGFARHLPEHGFRTTVFTAPEHPDQRVDPSYDEAALRACDVRRDYFTPEESARRPHRVAGTFAAPSAAWVRTRDLRGLARLRAELQRVPVVGPDTRLIPRLARRIARLAREVRPDLLFATAPPWEAAFAAALAARLTRLPLVLDLRDPWSFNPGLELKPAWARLATRAAEAALLRAPDALVTTTEAIRDAYAPRLSGHPVACVRSGFEDGPVEPRRDGAVSLIHFGNCYGYRNLAAYLRALALVVRRRGLARGAIRLLNLGRVAGEDLELAAQLGIAHLFEHRTVLPYAEGISLVAGADLALLPGFGDEPWFIPGKLYDYLLARAPILAVSASPEVQRILTATRLGWSCPPDAPERLARIIEDAIDARAAGRRLVEPEPAALAALTTAATTAELAALFERVTRR